MRRSSDRTFHKNTRKLASGIWIGPLYGQCWEVCIKRHTIQLQASVRCPNHEWTRITRIYRSTRNSFPYWCPFVFISVYYDIRRKRNRGPFSQLDGNQG